MNETEILGVRLRDFVRSSCGLCSHTVPSGKSKKLLKMEKVAQKFLKLLEYF